MATIRAYTTIEQSRKLAEILPLESADMMYHSVENEYGTGAFVATSKVITNGFKNDDFYIDDIPCWSLAALLNYLKSKNKFPEIKELSDGRFALTTYIWDGEDCIQNSIGVTIVDACYDIIIKLHEQNIL